MFTTDLCADNFVVYVRFIIINESIICLLILILAMARYAAKTIYLLLYVALDGLEPEIFFTEKNCLRYVQPLRVHSYK